MTRTDSIAKTIKTAHAAYVSAKAEADRLDDMINDAIDAGEEYAEIENEWEAAVSAEVDALDRLVAAMGRIGIEEGTARVMAINPKYAGRLADMCNRLAA